MRDPSIKAFSSHFVRRFPPVLTERPVQYVTFLRNPIEQFISYITYTRKHYAAIKDLVLLDHLPPQMPGLSIEKAPDGFSTGRTAPFAIFEKTTPPISTLVIRFSTGMASITRIAVIEPSVSKPPKTF